MTTMLERLKRQAREGASTNGHLMKRYRGRRFWGTAYAECACCGATVDVCVNPAPNATNISGDAVATFCRTEAVSEKEGGNGDSDYLTKNGRARKYPDATEKGGGVMTTRDRGNARCKHPSNRLFAWRAYDGVLCVACCECGGVLRGGADEEWGDGKDA